MRQDYEKFVERGAEIIAIGPDGPNAFRKYWQENKIPFPGCADLRSRVANRYDQEVSLLKFGRMPALFIVDKQGMIRYSHYGDSMADIPSNESILKLLDELNAEPS